MRITIEVTVEQYRLLEALAHKTTGTEGPGRALRVRGVLAHLVHSAVDGVRRPGSWERGWLMQAFGDSWVENLVRDPSCEFYDQPKGDRP